MLKLTAHRTRIGRLATTVSCAVAVVLWVAAPASASTTSAEALAETSARTVDEVSDLRQSLGTQAVIDIDAASETPSVVANTSGFLTAPTEQPPEEVIKGFLLDHRDLYGLGPDEVAGLRLVRNYESRGRVNHLSFAQTFDGIEAVEAGVQANVTTEGQLINVIGPTDPSLRVESVTPLVDRDEALAVARRSLDSPSATQARPPGSAPELLNGARAQLVIDDSAAGQARLAWRTVLLDGEGRTHDIRVDAATGKVLASRDLSSDANALVFDNYPGAPAGGSQHSIDLGSWVTDPGGPRLIGPYAYAFSELDDDNFSDPGEEVPPSSGDDYEYPYVPFDLEGAYPCPPAPFYCSWDPLTPFSWEDNQHRAAVQLFYGANRFHDHLLASPIEFTPAKNNYEGTGRMLVSANEGADTDAGLPDPDHVNNAFFSFSPSGPGYITALLFGPHPLVPDDQPAVNAADDTSLVFHEYTHGLSSRLIVDAQGFDTLISHQARSLGEAWSDWYALDYMVAEGLIADTAASGEVFFDQLTPGGREQAIDCAVDAPAGACPAAHTAGSGGFTYGDMGKVIDTGPETHADGEIWAQTLWDLRKALVAEHGADEGISRARLFITAGMELSPDDPTFLDARNSILLADLTYNNGEDYELIWDVFANRGMGFFASTVDGSTVEPIEDFSTVPSGSVGAVSGKVTSKSGAALPGARVYIGGYAQGLVDTTNGSGRFRIDGLPAGTYPQLVAAPRLGFDGRVAEDVTVPAGVTTSRNLKLTRDWAAAEGGAHVVDAVGPHLSSSCEPEQLIDQRFGTGWLTRSPALDSQQKSVTVRLPRSVRVSQFAIEPSAEGCGRGYTASLGEYRVQVGVKATKLRTAASGEFTQADLWQRNMVRPKRGLDKIRYVRLVAESTVDSEPYRQGAKFLAMTELQVYGRPR